jgi:hypothetical protein
MSDQLSEPPKEHHVTIEEKPKNENKKKIFDFFKRKKNQDELERPPSPVLPLVKFDSQGDFSKEVLESM